MFDNIKSTIMWEVLYPYIKDAVELEEVFKKITVEDFLNFLEERANEMASF
jgi:hypothetical protein